MDESDSDDEFHDCNDPYCTGRDCPDSFMYGEFFGKPAQSRFPSKLQTTTNKCCIFDCWKTYHKCLSTNAPRPKDYATKEAKQEDPKSSQTKTSTSTTSKPSTSKTEPPKMIGGFMPPQKKDSQPMRDQMGYYYAVPQGLGLKFGQYHNASVNYLGLDIGDSDSDPYDFDHSPTASASSFYETKSPTARKKKTAVRKTHQKNWPSTPKPNNSPPKNPPSRIMRITTIPVEEKSKSGLFGIHMGNAMPLGYMPRSTGWSEDEEHEPETNYSPDTEKDFERVTCPNIYDFELRTSSDLKPADENLKILIEAEKYDREKIIPYKILTYLQKIVDYITCESEELLTNNVKEFETKRIEHVEDIKKAIIFLKTRLKTLLNTTSYTSKKRPSKNFETSYLAENVINKIEESTLIHPPYPVMTIVKPKEFLDDLKKQYSIDFAQVIGQKLYDSYECYEYWSFDEFKEFLKNYYFITPVYIKYFKEDNLRILMNSKNNGKLENIILACLIVFLEYFIWKVRERLELVEEDRVKLLDEYTEFWDNFYFATLNVDKSIGDGYVSPLQERAFDLWKNTFFDHDMILPRAIREKFIVFDPEKIIKVLPQSIIKSYVVLNIMGDKKLDYKTRFATKLTPEILEKFTQWHLYDGADLIKKHIKLATEMNAEKVFDLDKQKRKTLANQNPTAIIQQQLARKKAYEDYCKSSTTMKKEDPKSKAKKALLPQDDEKRLAQQLENQLKFADMTKKLIQSRTTKARSPQYEEEHKIYSQWFPHLKVVSSLDYDPTKLYFRPPSIDWRKQKSSQLGLGGHILPIDFGKEREIPWNFFPNDRRRVHEIIPDGNCLFRAFAYFITGRCNDNSHVKMRESLCQYMKRNKDDLSVRLLVKMDVMTYLERNDRAIWKPATEDDMFEKYGTDVEISIFAKMVNCTVYVWNPGHLNQLSDRTKWNLFGTPSPEKPSLFLSFEGGCHFNVCLM